jgi:hypothetical protein
VADPTGTPLNVRTRPNGPIFADFPNGTGVVILDRQNDWVVASSRASTAGWVYLPYLAVATLTLRGRAK